MWINSTLWILVDKHWPGSQASIDGWVARLAPTARVVGPERTRAPVLTALRMNTWWVPRVPGVQQSQVPSVPGSTSLRGSMGPPGDPWEPRVMFGTRHAMGKVRPMAKIAWPSLPSRLLGRALKIDCPTLKLLSGSKVLQTDPQQKFNYFYDYII